MLKRTFIHLPGVGPRRETHFWRQGLATWEDFLAAKRLQGLSRNRLDWLQAELTRSLEHLADAAYFAARLQAGEHWRLFQHFRTRTALSGHRDHRHRLAGPVGDGGGPL